MEYGEKRYEKAVTNQVRNPAMRSYLKWLEKRGIIRTAGEVLDEAAMKQEIANLKIIHDELKRKYGRTSKSKGRV